MATVKTWAGWALVVGWLAACGTQGDASVLPDSWPRSGLSGYRLLDADAPYALGRLGWDLDEPTVLSGTAPAAGEGSDSFEVWGRMSPRLSPEKTLLFRASLRATLPNAEAEPDEALAATQSWEGRGLRSPTLLSLSDGSGKGQTELLLLYQGEFGDIGAAAVRGESVDKLSLDAPFLAAAQLTGSTTASLGRIAATVVDERVYLFYTVDDRELRVAQSERAALRRYLSAADTMPTWRLGGTLLVASAASVPPGDNSAVPAERIAQVAVRRQITPTGRARWDVALRAQAGREVVLLAASAYAAPDHSERVGPIDAFLPAAAALIKTSEGTVGAPSFASLRGRQLLFFGLRSVSSQIAVATQPQ